MHCVILGHHPTVTTGKTLWVVNRSQRHLGAGGNQVIVML